jgi:NADPH-dependent ferric siderophore reductase
MSLPDEKSPGALAQIALFLHRKGRRVWTLRIEGKRDLTPRLTRVDFSGADLDELVWKRGQDLMLELPQADGTIARRHYTIRDHSAAEKMLAIDFVRHGDSPSARWLDRVRPGDRIAAGGPRGRTVLNERAGWHLLLGDETSVPAVLAILVGLPAGAKALALLEVGHADDRLVFAAQPGASLEWIIRDTSRNDALVEKVRELALPDGSGHAYVTGETSLVRTLRHILLARGLAKEAIAAEGYWRPGRIGGHDHV